MPTRKEWVVDEKGFHAKSVWESASTDKTPANLDDDKSQKTAKDNKKKLRLSDGVFLPGPEGFKFLKECKVKVKVELPPDMKNASITFKLFSLYNDGKEDIEYDHKHQVSVDTKDGYAEAVIKQLFYDENYVNDKDKAPDAKCKYFFMASHPRAEEEKKSEYLEMPQENAEEELYGGFELQQGDNDAKKKWGGREQEKEGEFVEELQKDLVKLGYWVSNASDTNGMKCSGTFDKYIAGAITTFQRENKLTEDGILKKDTGNKIKECCKKDNYQHPAHKAGTYGDFIQLKPSENYNRYFATYDDSNILSDIWGTSGMIKMIEDVAKEWKSKGLGLLMIGDISLYNGGKFTGHDTHRDGTGVDIDHSACSIDKSGFNTDNSLKLAELFKKHGAKRILFNCKYVTDNCTIAYPCEKHHNHFHVDTKESKKPKENQDDWLCKKCNSSNSADCKHKVKNESEDNKKEENKDDDKKN